MITPNSEPGVIILDDIRYDATTCEQTIRPPTRGGRPDIMVRYKFERVGEPFSQRFPRL